MINTTEKIIAGILVLGLFLGGGVLISAVSNSIGTSNNLEHTPIVSSIRVEDVQEVDDVHEAEESKQLAPLAQITQEQAIAIALAAVNTDKVGKMTDVQLENEDGNVVYAVEFTKNGIETDVKIDAGNGKVLLIEDDTTESDQD